LGVQKYLLYMIYIQIYKWRRVYEFKKVAKTKYPVICSVAGGVP
jgi:hypothetical protein